MCLCKVIQYMFIYIQKIGRKWTNLVKIGSLHRPTACPGQKTLAHGPPGPENGSPWPGPQKKWPENNVFMQSYLIYMSIFKKYLISVPSWSRGFTLAYHIEGLRFKTRLGQKKSFSFFSIFSWTQPKYQQNPKLIFEICTLFLTEIINFAYKCNKKAIKTSKSYVLKFFLLWHIYLAFCSYVS